MSPNRTTASAAALPPSIFPRHLWGSLAYTATPPTGSPYGHVTIEFHRLPEGMSLLARCERCGGRLERLLPADPATMQQNTDPVSVLASAANDLGGLLAAWMPMHGACAERPIRWGFPTTPDVRGFVERAVAGERARLQRGQRMGGWATVLSTTGDVLVFRVSDLPPSTPTHGYRPRLIELATRHYIVRHQAKRRGLDLAAAVLVSEAWTTSPEPPPGMSPKDVLRAAATNDVETYPWLAGALHPNVPGAAPERRESAIFSVVTTEFGMGAMTPIVRRGGRIDEGPGDFGDADLTWRPLLGTASTVDGLLATPVQREVSYV